MKGYNTLRECIEDCKLLVAAKGFDPGRKGGETVSSYLQNKIRRGIQNASPAFKESVRREQYTLFDFGLIAVHDTFRDFEGIYDFCKFITNADKTNTKLRKVLNSTAFRKGKLHALNEYIPQKIKNKGEFIEFIKSNESLSHNAIKIICNKLCRKHWKQWHQEAIKERAFMHLRREMF